MIDIDFIQEVFQTVTQQKWRSLMTAFGVFWGIFMLVILIGCGMGLNNGLLGGLKNLPENSIFLIAGNTDVAYHGLPRGRKWQMTNDDNKAIFAKLGNVAQSLAALSATPDGLIPHNVDAGNQTGQYVVAGVTPNYYNAMPNKIVSGRYINDIDIEEQRKVCVIGINTAKQLFPGQDNYLGRSVVIDGSPYEIVGVNLNPNKTISIGADPSESILMPISTLQVAYNRIGQVDISVIVLRDDCPTANYKDMIIETMKKRHDIAPNDDVALTAIDLSEQLQQYLNLFTGINALIWIVGLGTLIAGLVGISNIMLITVRERTKEFGIRQAIGAEPSSIIKQIISESLLLTVSSGFIGLCAGSGILYVINSIMARQASDDSMFANPYMPFGAAVGALIVLILGGILAGLFPARRALQIKAIEALADE